VEVEEEEWVGEMAIKEIMEIIQQEVGAGGKELEVEEVGISEVVEEVDIWEEIMDKLVDSLGEVAILIPLVVISEMEEEMPKESEVVGMDLLVGMVGRLTEGEVEGEGEEISRIALLRIHCQSSIS
jgi:hypothetical protein